MPGSVVDDNHVMDVGNLSHLLRRTEFVARPERLTELSGATRAEAVDDILDVPADPVPYPEELQVDLAGSTYEHWVTALAWWLDRMVDAPRPVQERMTFFWHGHFCSSWEKVLSSRAMLEQNSLFRSESLGNLHALVSGMALQPAMLYYLDNHLSAQDSPNQNFGRELLELFTIGIGAYTEDDVAACARAWTGHSIDEVTENYLFRPTWHDPGPFSFMDVTRAWDGPEIIDYLLLENPTTALTAARFVTRKLWRHLAHSSPSTTVVDDLAAVLLDNDFEVRPWLRALLMRDEFYAAGVKRGLVRQPVDFIVAVMAATGFRSADLDPQWFVQGMGQVPFAPPNVAGWKTNSYWTSASQFSARGEFARHVTWKLRDGGAHGLAAGRTPAQAVDAAATMFGLSLAGSTRTALIEWETAQRAAEPWTGWWESTNLLTLMMTTPEMHLA